MLSALLLTPVGHALALDPSGDADTTFSGDGYQGINITLRNTDAGGRGVAVQSDGKILVTGDYWDNGVQRVAVTRFNSDGSVDATFGSGGEVKTVIAGSANDIAFGIAVQSNGRIVVVGSSNPAANENYLVLRYLDNGTLDTSFSGDGIFTLDAALAGNTFDRARGVAVQPDQKIVVIGYSTIGAGDERDAVVFRLNANGTLDTGFSGDGIAYVSTSAGSTVDEGLAVAVTPGGLIYGVGRSANNNASMFRLTTTGALDTSFDGDGIVLFNPSAGSGSRFLAVAIDGLGRPVAAGGRSSQVFVARFTTTGAPDNTFDSDGWMTTPIQAGQSRANGVAVAPDGSVYASGFTDNDNSGNFDMFAVRLTSAGALDVGFSSDGKVTADPSGSGLIDNSQSAAVQTDNKILVVGYSNTLADPTAPRIAVLRYLTNGNPDSTFDGDGIVFRQLQGGSVDVSYGVAVDGSSRVLITGYSDVGNHSDLVLARMSDTGTLDNTWDGDGIALVGGATTQDEGRGIVFQSDGKPLVGGDRANVSAPASPRLAVYRFTTGGVLDTGYSGDGIAEAVANTNSVEAAGALIDGSGRALVFGQESDSGSNSDFAIARFTTTGAADATFDGDGKRLVSVGAGFDGARAAAIQGDGKIVLGGYTTISGAEHWALLRLNADGSTDTTFNGDGNADGIIVTTEGTGNLPRNRIQHVSILPDGKIHVLGASNPDATNNRPRSGRYLANGAVDTTYNTTGFQTISFGSNRIDNIHAGARQFDEKQIVFGAVTPSGQGTDYHLARINWDDGSLDATFGTAGVRLFAASAGRDIGQGGIVDTTGRALITGEGNSGDLGVARFQRDPAPTPAGTPDLVNASDSGRFNNDNITNDNTPSFTGSCVIGETVVLYTNGSEHAPRARHLCRSTTYTLTAPPLADGNYTVAVREINGSGQASLSSSLAITVDTVASAPTISAPTPNQKITIPPSTTLIGAGAEGDADVIVVNGASQLCNNRAALTPATNAAWNCVTTLGLGAYTLDVTQTDIAGNTSNAASIAFSQVVQTTAALTSSINPTRFGQSATFNATIQTNPTNFATPSGCVIFTIAGTPTACLALVNGSVSTITSSLPVGSHAVGVAFAEQNFFLASNAGLSGGHEVIKANTSTAPAVTVNPAVFGQANSLTIPVLAVAPGAGVVAGDVEVNIGGVISTVALVNGSVSIDLGNLAVGNYAITAGYAGNVSFNASTGALASNLVVNKANVNLDVITPMPTPRVGQAFNLDLFFNRAAPTSATPSGQTSVTINGSPLATLSPSVSNQPQALNLNAAGTYSINMDYAGDANFNALNHSENISIARAATSLTLMVDRDPSLSHENKTFTIDADALAPANTTPTGIIHLTIGSLPVIDLVPTNGVASYTSNAIPPGPHAVSAVLDADANSESSSVNLLGGITVIDTNLFADGFE